MHSEPPEGGATLPAHLAPRLPRPAVELDEPAHGWVALHDRGGREVVVGAWGAEQISAALHDELTQIVARQERPAGALGRRRPPRDGETPCGACDPRELGRRPPRGGEDPCRACGPRARPHVHPPHVHGEWKPDFAGLLERALVHPWCVAQDPARAPGEALFTLHHETCESTFVGPRSCDIRACPKCNGRRFADELDGVDHLVSAAKVENWRCRMLTLTVRNFDDLREGVEAVQQGVKMLRRRKWFGELVRAGLVAIQHTKYGATWHVHAHLVLYARRFIPKKWIDDAWREIMGDELVGKQSGVDIRQWDGGGVQAFKEALGYVYPTKPRLAPDLRDYVEQEIALQGKRLIVKFGQFHGKGRPRLPRACSCCLVTDSHWKHAGAPLLEDLAAFVHAHKTLPDGSRLDRVVMVARGRKWKDVNPRLRIAQRRERAAIAAGPTAPSSRRPRLPAPTRDELGGLSS